MLVMTYSEARQNFASLLDKSEEDGAAFVKRADGSLFRISPEKSSKSPFEGIKTLFDLQHSDIRQALRETREENKLALFCPLRLEKSFQNFTIT